MFSFQNIDYLKESSSIRNNSTLGLFVFTIIQYLHFKTLFLISMKVSAYWFECYFTWNGFKAATTSKCNGVPKDKSINNSLMCLAPFYYI